MRNSAVASLRCALRVAVVWCLAAAAVAPLAIAESSEVTSTQPKTKFWDGAHMAQLCASHPENDPKYKEVLKRLKKNAEKAVARGPYSVMDKKEVGPSGDKHDYLSYARYWWPNPNTSDGLPYIRRDGKTNDAASSRATMSRCATCATTSRRSR